MISFKNIENCSRIIGVGTATQKTFYSQHEVLEIFKIKDRRIRGVFLNGTIRQRSLNLPLEEQNGIKLIETQGELLKKHRDDSLDMGVRALSSCLEQINTSPDKVQYLCCVTSTGLLTPGVSALISNKLKLRTDCARLDIVGMGCNAGLNALNAVSSWTLANPGKLAILLCVEVCSAAYVFEDSIETAVVNSLFGDGAAAIAVIANTAPLLQGDAAVLKFTSCLIPDTIDLMRFNWNDDHGKYSFFLDPKVPYMIGEYSEKIINLLLEGTDLRRSDITHWIVHSGGKKVIDSIKVNLGLSTYDLRHTLGILCDYGNLSSGSFLFSFERLRKENIIKSGDIGVLMTMGPGSTIETALIRW